MKRTLNEKAAKMTSTASQVKSRQSWIDFSKSKTVSQSTINNLVMNYVIQGTCPLRTVECDAFKELVTGLAPDASLMTRPTLTRHLHDRKEKLLRLRLKTAPGIREVYLYYSRCLVYTWAWVSWCNRSLDDQRKHDKTFGCTGVSPSTCNSQL